MQNQLILILCGMLGVLFQTLLKMKSLKELADAGNIHFSAGKDYFQRDWVAISLAVLSVFIWYLVFREAAATYPKLEGLARTSFVLAGGVGSFFIQYAFGGSKKIIKAVIDAKTNRLDQLTGETEKTILPSKPQS